MVSSCQRCWFFSVNDVTSDEWSVACSSRVILLWGCVHPEEHHAKHHTKTYGIYFFQVLRFFSDKQDGEDRIIKLTLFKDSGQICNCISKKMKGKKAGDTSYTDLSRRLNGQIFMTEDFIFVFAVCAHGWHQKHSYNGHNPNPWPQ